MAVSVFEFWVSELFLTIFVLGYFCLRGTNIRWDGICNHWWTVRKLQQDKAVGQRSFRCFRSHLVELTATDHTWPITDTDSALCTLEDCVILAELMIASVTAQAISCVNTNKPTYLLTFVVITSICICMGGTIIPQFFCPAAAILTITKTR